MYSAKYGGRSGRSKGKQATSKKKKHQKCTLCQEKGHDAEDCPRVKNPTKNSGGAGSGRSHKTSRRPGGKEEGKMDTNGGSEDSGLLPLGFYANVDDLVAEIVVAADEAPPPPVLFDAGCDVGEALDIIASANKKKSAPVTYRNATAAIPYAGCLCRQLLKPGKPWKATSERATRMKEADPSTLFVLGLSNGFLVDGEDEDDEEAAISALLSAFDADESVVGVFAKLDYSILDRPGCDREAQLRRFRATCIAATDADAPIQCRVAPGPSEAASISEGEDEETDEDNVDPYILVMRDLATLLLEMSPEDACSTLKIHLSCWNGSSTHMMKLLGAFPDNLYIGMNAAVGFAKATSAHECAFDVPLNRLLLETDAPHAIPAPVTIAMGRAAFCHSGLVPFVADAVAEHKSNLGVTAVDVARAATNNVVQLYGQAVAECVGEASAELEELISTARKEKEEAELEEAAKELGLEGKTEEVFESKQDKKKKRKKKGKGGGSTQGAGEEGTAELNFDEGFLAAMVDDNQ